MGGGRGDITKQMHFLASLLIPPTHAYMLMQHCTFKEPVSLDFPPIKKITIPSGPLVLPLKKIEFGFLLRRLFGF